MSIREMSAEEIEVAAGGWKWLAEGAAWFAVETGLKALWDNRNQGGPDPSLDYLNGYHGA
jgi:hypothetical protein